MAQFYETDGVKRAAGRMELIEWRAINAETESDLFTVRRASDGTVERFVNSQPVKRLPRSPVTRNLEARFNALID